MGASPGLDYQACLQAAVESGRAAFPEISVDLAAFERQLSERSGAAAGELEKLHASDLYLAFACAQGDKAALRIFDESLLVPVTTRLRGRTVLQVDLPQELRERLLVGVLGRAPRIAEYAGRGSLASWVRVAALRLLVNLGRGERPPLEQEETAATVAAHDPEMVLLRARCQGALEESLKKGFAALEPHERTFLRQHFVEGLSIDRLAPLHGIHRATAARRLASTRARLLAETVRELRTTHAIAQSEVKSLLRLVRSQLNLSLRTLMA